MRGELMILSESFEYSRLEIPIPFPVRASCPRCERDAHTDGCKTCAVVY